MIRDKALPVCKSTFYKYAGLLKIKREKTAKRHCKNKKGIRADRPLAILHMDVTVFRTEDNKKAYLYIIQDNFSRAILSMKASLSYRAEVAKENLLNAITTHNLLRQHLSLITDDGIENKGAVTELLKQPDIFIKQVIAQSDIVQSNSMIEAFNKIVKHRFLYWHPIADFTALQKFVADIPERFNNMPLMALQALTPLEVLKGLLPDSDLFKEGVAAATERRKISNQLTHCTDLCKVKATGSF